MTEHSVAPSRAKKVEETFSKAENGVSITGNSVTCPDRSAFTVDGNVSTPDGGVSNPDNNVSTPDGSVPLTDGGSDFTIGFENVSKRTSGTSASESQSLWPENSSCVKLKGYQEELDLNLQKVHRQKLTQENEPFLKCEDRERTLPTNLPNRSEVLLAGFCYSRADGSLRCYSCDGQISGNRYSNPWDYHGKNCLHCKIKLMSLSEEDVFVNKNPADKEACFVCQVKLKTVLLTTCGHLTYCSDCLLHVLHSQPREATGIPDDYIKCPYCEQLSDMYTMVKWE